MEQGLFVKLLVTGTAMSSRRDHEMQAKPTTTKRLAVEASTELTGQRERLFLMSSF